VDEGEAAEVGAAGAFDGWAEVEDFGVFFDEAGDLGGGQAVLVVDLAEGEVVVGGVFEGFGEAFEIVLVGGGVEGFDELALLIGEEAGEGEGGEGGVISDWCKRRGGRLFDDWER
jgi:hypothetical protein